LIAVAPPLGGFYRIARGDADPFTPPDWSRADPEDGTFGNRFDDPGAIAGRPTNERFRTIYCTTQRDAAFGETLARFRLSIPLLAQLANIDDAQTIEAALSGVIDDSDKYRGVVPTDWRLRRRIGHTLIDPDLRFVDVAAAETVQRLRSTLAPLGQVLNLPDIDLSSLTSSQRAMTQACARMIYEEIDEHGRPLYAGVRYPSRLGEDWECWAVFDDRIRHAPGWPALSCPIVAEDPDLERVASMFHLSIETGPGTYHRP
jgi:hypothetical protein